MKTHLYRAADIYVSLSDNLQETFGISIIEAMAAGLPVIASDINGYSELISHNETGCRIPVTWIRDFNLVELADIMNFGTMQLILAQCMAMTVVDLLSHGAKLAYSIKDEFIPEVRREKYTAFMNRFFSGR